jgi:DNA-binding XRE family transcriptional regulator
MSEPCEPDGTVMTASETTAERLVRLRRCKGWSQARMAEFLGVAQSTVGGYERGLPPLGPVIRLLDILEFGPDGHPSSAGGSPLPSSPADPAAGAVPPAPAALSGEAA